MPLDKDQVWLERTGERELTGHTPGGVEIPIGHGEGRVSPGELLKLALGGCAGMTMDFTAARRLGDDFPLRIVVGGQKDADRNLYPVITEQIELDLSALSEDDQQALSALITKAVQVGCTVERTVQQDIAIEHQITNAAKDAQ